MLPKVKFGICPKCGRAGLDEDGNKLTGYELTDYKGEIMCTLCIIRLQDEEADQIGREQDVEFQQFKDAIGMKSTPQ